MKNINMQDEQKDYPCLSEKNCKFCADDSCIFWHGSDDVDYLLKK